MNLRQDHSFLIEILKKTTIGYKPDLQKLASGRGQESFLTQDDRFVDEYTTHFKQVIDSFDKPKEGLSHLNQMLLILVRDYLEKKDHYRTTIFYSVFQDLLDEFFDNYKELEDEEVLLSLTNLCRKLNEDDTIKEFRNFHLKHFEKEAQESKESGNIYRDGGVEKVKVETFKNEMALREKVLAFSSDSDITEEVKNTFRKLIHHHLNDIKALSSVNLDRNTRKKYIVFGPEPNPDDEKRLIADFQHMVAKFDVENEESKIDFSFDIMLDIFLICDTIPPGYTAFEQEYFSTIRKKLRLFEISKIKYREMMRVQDALADRDNFHTEVHSKNIHISYRKEADTPNVTLKVESIVPCNMLNILVLIYEIDLYPQWVPMCSRCTLYKQLDKTTRAVYMRMDVPKPVSDREGYVAGFGINRLDHNGTVLTVSESFEEDYKFMELSNMTIPPLADLTVRFKVHYFGYEMEPIEHNKTRLRAVMNIDPKLDFLPPFFISWVSRKFGTSLFEKLIQRVKSHKGTPWESRMTESEHMPFYNWVLSGVNKYLDEKTNQKDGKIQIQSL